MKAQQVERFMAAARKDSDIPAVSIRLVSADKSVLEQRIWRLKVLFGAELSVTQPRQSGHGLEWIAYGTFI